MVRRAGFEPANGLTGKILSVAIILNQNSKCLAPLTWLGYLRILESSLRDNLKLYYSLKKEIEYKLKNKLVYKSHARQVFLPFAFALSIALLSFQATLLSSSLKKSPPALIPFIWALTADLTTSAI